MSGYERPAAGRSGLRLHLNEHTGGCSPKVLERLRQLDAADVGLYPDYGEIARVAAEWFGVRPDEIILTNGLDEGILGASVFALRGRAESEAIVVEPAFDVYEVSVRALAATVVRARFGEHFTLAAEDVLARVTPNTRLIFLNDPHNPSGARVVPAVIRAIAQSAPQATVFVDEAYAEFAAGTSIPWAVREATNVLVGRTFAKAYGLAGVRLGAVLGSPALIEALTEIVPPYSVNAYAAAALVAALADRDYIEDYIAQSARSRELVADFCRRRGLHAFPSAANFVLIRVGNAPALVAALAQKGVYVRDRSDQPGCAGCIRMTAGLIDDTRRALEVLEEVLCAAP